jgi:2-oxoglutarate ferredoxin oxidoreductase subunit alpha
VLEFIQNHETIYVLENNRDGQMHAILALELPEKAVDLVSLAVVDGLPISAEWIREAILQEENL